MTGLIFTLLYLKFGLSAELGISIVYACLMLLIFVIDLEHLLILDIITYPAMILALVFSLFWPGIETAWFLSAGALGRLLTSLAGGIFGLVLMALPFVLYRRGMGMGDVKLGMLVGLMVGYPLAFIAVVMSWIASGLVAGTLLVLKIKGRKDVVPFAPFLATSTLITLFWGQAIWHWYL